MNRHERKLLARIYTCVGRLGSVGPRNPADIALLAKADRIVSQAAPQVASAISCLGFGDYAEAADYIADAERSLGLKVHGVDEDAA